MKVSQARVRRHFLETLALNILEQQAEISGTPVSHVRNTQVTTRSHMRAASFLTLYFFAVGREPTYQHVPLHGPRLLVGVELAADQSCVIHH